MKQPNYELLGRKWDYNKPLPELIEHRRQKDAKFGKVPDSARIRQKLLYPALRHLGFGPIGIDDVRKEIDHGVDLAVEYFHGTWWYTDEISDDRDSLKAMDKKRPWYEALTSSLFLAGLVGRWDDIGKIGSWFDATIEPEYQAGQIEDEYMQLFICIAGSLSPQPMEGAAELLAKVKKCRTKRPRLLCAAWEAANAADQAAFDKAFPETVKHFLSKPEGGQVYDWVAIDQSSVWLIAEHRGLTLPPLSEKLQAAVVTRQSVGLVE